MDQIQKKTPSVSCVDNSIMRLTDRSIPLSAVRTLLPLCDRTEPRGTDVRRIGRGTPDIEPQHIMPQHHMPLLTQPTDVRFKDTPPSITSETSTSPECQGVQRDHIRQILAGCNNAVMYASHRFNGG